MAGLEELTANIWQWGVDRRIHENSTAAAQVRKAFEEYIELLRDLEADGPDVEALKDDIGDIYVCLVQVCGCLGVPVPEIQFMVGRERIGSSLEMLWMITAKKPFCGVMATADVSTAIQYMLQELNFLSTDNGFSFAVAVHKAWNEIKDRKGYLREDGIFVKETA